MRSKAIIAALAVLTVACGKHPEPALDSIELGPPAGPVTLVREAKGGDEGGYDLFHPARPMLVNGSVWVLEAGNDQLVRFDSSLSSAQAFGREGEGPGEIQFAQDFVVDDGRMIVAESGNGRLSIWDTAGVFRATVITERAPRFVAASGSELLVTLDVWDAYAYRLADGGRFHPHAKVPEPIRELARTASVYHPAGPYIAAGPGGEVLVLDQSVLAVARYDSTGRLLGARLLPDPFRAELLALRQKMLSGFGSKASAFVDSPAAKRIWSDPEGRLLVLFPLPDSWGLLIDPETWVARPLILPAEPRLREILWAASDATLYGARLYVISGGQLYQFAVSDWS